KFTLFISPFQRIMKAFPVRVEVSENHESDRGHHSAVPSTGLGRGRGDRLCPDRLLHEHAFSGPVSVRHLWFGPVSHRQWPVPLLFRTHIPGAAGRCDTLGKADAGIRLPIYGDQRRRPIGPLIGAYLGVISGKISFWITGGASLVY